MLDFFGIGTKRASAGQVSIYPARVGQAVDCARIHAAAFANAWSETELESMLLAANTIGDCAAIALNNCVAGFVLSLPARFGSVPSKKHGVDAAHLLFLAQAGVIGHHAQMGPQVRQLLQGCRRRFIIKIPFRQL